MTLKGRSRVGVCVLLLVAPCLAHGQTPRAGVAPAVDPPSINQSLDSLQALVRRVPNASLGVNFAEFRLRLVLDKLRPAAAAWPADMPVAFRANVDGSVRALQQSIGTTDPERLEAVLGAVAADLEVKLEHSSQGSGAPGEPVAVSVRTVQGDPERRDWRVFYLSRVADVAGGASPSQFKPGSSPITEPLVAGRYVMWVSDPAGTRTGDKIAVKVGEGKKELTVDLPVPAP